MFHFATNNNKILAIISLGLLTVVWSLAWVIMKQVTPYIGAFNFTALRCSLSAVLLFLLLRLRGESLRPTPIAYTLGIALFQTCGMQGLAQWALTTGGVGKVAILTYTMPFWVILFAALMLNEKIRWLQLVAIVLAAAGLVLVLEPWLWHKSSLISTLLAIASGMSWGFSTIITRKMYMAAPNTGLLSVTAWQMAYASLILVIVAFFIPQQPTQWNWHVIQGLGYSAIFATAIAWSLWLFVLKTLPASTAGLSILSVPVCGVLLSWWLLGESPGVAQGWGITVIVVALALAASHNRVKS